jgi:pyruvate dehydrogenase E2 component (dihydrolipoamide acetyltransferase)
MATEFKLPELGENIESGDLVRLMIKPGGNISEGEPVMELETDKAVVVVPSSVTGTIGEVRVKEGDKLRVGQVIFTVENGSGAATTIAASEKEKPSAQASTVPATSATATPVSATAVSKTPAQPAPTPPQVDRRAKPAVAAPTEFKLPELG